MTEPAIRRDPLPIALAVLWGPAGLEAPQPLKQPYPIFLHQKPLRQLLAHTRTSADKILLGLLLGDVRECPESGITYVVVEQMLRVDLEVRGDDTAALMPQLWPRLQEKLKGQAAGPVGWYHSHPTGGLVLSAQDIETQTRHFPDPWQAVLLLATEGGKPIAGWFRVTADDSWKTTPLPFYEILAPESVDSTGKKRSFVDWVNYKAYKALAPSVAPRAVESPPPARAVPQPPRAAPPPRQAPAPRPPAAPPPPREAVRAPSPPPPREPVRAQAPPPPAEPARVEPLKNPPVEEKKPILPEDLVAPEPTPQKTTPPPPPPGRPPSRESHAAPAPTVRVSTAAPRAVEAPRKPTRVRPLRHMVTASVAAAALVAMFVGAWAAGLIPLGRSGDFAATESAAPANSTPRPTQDPTPVGGQPVDAPPQSTPTQAAPPPAPAAAPINPALVALDQLTDSVLASLRTYGARRTQFGRGTADCAALAEALVLVESRWINYNVQGRPRDLVLDATRAARDRSLYAEVDSVETHFDGSACPRP